MLEPKIADLRDILLGMVTNSEMQATGWARDIIEKLKLGGYELIRVAWNTEESRP